MNNKKVDKMVLYVDANGGALTYEEAGHMEILNVYIDDATNTITVEVGAT